MKQLIISVALVLLFTACEQDDFGQTGSRYVNLGNAIASQSKSFSLDIDKDGDTEFLFTTLLAADANGDQRQFIISPARSNQVFEVNGRVGVLNAGQQIAPGNPFDKNVQPMVVKRLSASGASWSGDWKEASNKYIGIRFRLADQEYYYGWIRVSFDIAKEQFVIHDLAYRPVVNVGIIAGIK